MKSKAGLAAGLLTALLSAAVLPSCGIVILNDRGQEGTSVPPADHPPVTETTSSTVGQTTEKPPEENRPESAEEEASRLLSAVRTVNMDGVAMIIATTDESVVSIADDLTSSAKHWRNSKVENKLNTSLLVTAVDAETLLNDAREAINAGMYYADLLTIPAASLGSFVAADLLMNLNSLPFADFNMVYYNQDAIRQMTIGYHTYAAAGAFTETASHQNLVVYNQVLADRYGLPDLYALVSEGKWTWESLLTFIKTVQDDPDGTAAGLMTPFSKEFTADLLFASSGQHYMQTGRGVIPTVEFDNDTTTALIETAYRVLTAENTLFDRTGENAEVPGARDAFLAGNTLFALDTVTGCAAYQNMPQDWGVLPIPKLTGEQEKYYNYCSPDISVTAVLNGANDVDISGVLLQSLNAASYRVVNECYTDYLTNYVLRDNRELNMLALATANYHYDFAHMFGDAVRHLTTGTVEMFRTAAGRGTALNSYKYYKNLIEYNLNRKFTIPQ